MSAISNVLRQLVQRRLWPVAILLIAALAAVPLALSKQPESAAQPPVPVADDGEDVLASQPIVTAVTAADRTERRKVLGNAKNPFAVAKAETGSDAAVTSAKVAKATDPVPTPTPATGGTGTSTPTPTTTPPSVTPTDPGTTPTAPAPKTYDRFELTVRFGDSSGTARRDLERLQPLPSRSNPVLIYLGVLKDGKTAVFLINRNVQAVGDGKCHPLPELCETLRMKPGQTEFIDVIGEDGGVATQYQLDLLKIHKAETASAAKASASSKAGRQLLAARAETEGLLPFRFDADSGTLARRGGATGTATRSVASNVAAGAGSLR